MSKLFKFELPHPDSSAIQNAEPKSGTAASHADLPDLTKLIQHVHQKKRLSQMSLVARFMSLDPVARDAFEERAAILEFDAGFTREEAEAKAFQMVMQAFHDAE